MYLNELIQGQICSTSLQVISWFSLGQQDLLNNNLKISITIIDQISNMLFISLVFIKDENK